VTSSDGNDDPHRTGTEVAALLQAVEQAAEAEIERVGRQLRSARPAAARS
jgi:hypothetical protein